MCRVTMGHLRVTVSHPRVTIGHLRVTVGHPRVTIGHYMIISLPHIILNCSGECLPLLNHFIYEALKHGWLLAMMET